MDFIQPDISIVIPTHNPEERIFSRVLNAVERLKYQSESAIECVIVDNESERCVSELESVKAFLTRNPWAKVIRESRRGLTFSRLAGINATTGSYVAVFDDDNEPEEDYLQAARRCLERWPSVGVWGAGKIAVEFVDPVPEWFEQGFRGYFNERQQKDVEYGCVRATWTPFYPIGMGQIFRREVAQRYVEAVDSEAISASDRKEGSLASAGDVQLVWEAVKMGYAAGVHPDLRLTHLIPAKRCSIPYVRKLVFGCGVSYLPALVQSFPSEKANLDHSIPSDWRIGAKIIRITLRNLMRFRARYLSVELAHFLGDIVGRLRATNSRRGKWLMALVRLLRLE